MRKKMIIMARINEYMMRDRNRNVPYTPDEIADTAAACESEGASIIHFHARKPDGSPSHDPDTYLDIISKIRARSTVVIDSTLGQNTVKGDHNRAAHIMAMEADPARRADMAAIDVGSTNIDVYDAEVHAFRTTDKTYVNTIGTCMFLAEAMDKAGVKPHLTCWAVPFLKGADALLDMGVFKQPAYVQFAFCEGGIIGGHSCTIEDTLAFVRALPRDKRIEWTVTCKEGNLLPAAAVAIERGGHVSPGIGDYPYPELGCPTNAELVRFFAQLGRAQGREPATVAETRDMLGIAA